MIRRGRLLFKFLQAAPKAETRQLGRRHGNIEHGMTQGRTMAEGRKPSWQYLGARKVDSDRPNAFAHVPERAVLRFGLLVVLGTSAGTLPVV